MKVETIEALKKRMAEPCKHCVKETFKYLMDPQVQVLMEPWLGARDGMIQLHVHGHSVLTKNEVSIMFLMATYITEDVQILYFTPGSATVEGAFEILKEVVTREEKRRGKATGTTDDVGRRSKKKRGENSSAPGIDDRGVESGAGQKSAPAPSS